MLQPGLDMDRPLLISGVIEHVAAEFGDTEIVSTRERTDRCSATAMRNAPRARASSRMRLGTSVCAPAMQWRRLPGTTIGISKSITPIRGAAC